jgi:hypothetical protein
MNDLQCATGAEKPVVIDPLNGYPQKKWVSENGIQAIDSAPWLNKYIVGKETHFHSGYSSHWFKIDLPTAGSVHTGYDTLCRIALNFRTVDNAKIAQIELYDGPRIRWERYNSGLQGDHARSIGPKNCWNFEPALSIKHNLCMVLSVEFGAPKQYVPEFVFFVARVLVSSSDYFQNVLNF